MLFVFLILLFSGAGVFQELFNNSARPCECQAGGIVKPSLNHNSHDFSVGKIYGTTTCSWPRVLVDNKFSRTQFISGVPVGTYDSLGRNWLNETKRETSKGNLRPVILNRGFKISREWFSVNIGILKRVLREQTDGEINVSMRDTAFDEYYPQIDVDLGRIPTVNGNINRRNWTSWYAALAKKSITYMPGRKHQSVIRREKPSPFYGNQVNILTVWPRTDTNDWDDISLRLRNCPIETSSLLGAGANIGNDNEQQNEIPGQHSDAVVTHVLSHSSIVTRPHSTVTA
jgi:hypothetical protein